MLTSCGHGSFSSCAYEVSCRVRAGDARPHDGATSPQAVPESGPATYLWVPRSCRVSLGNGFRMAAGFGVHPAGGDLSMSFRSGQAAELVRPIRERLRDRVSAAAESGEGGNSLSEQGNCEFPPTPPAAERDSRHRTERANRSGARGNRGRMLQIGRIARQGISDKSVCSWSFDAAYARPEFTNP